ncbi:MAG: ABC transporter substrate-binding protein [Lachnospiraceae bacterium]|nr:ABC transporter substrate-binding protein [Lachnospiraceae bacterium]
MKKISRKEFLRGTAAGAVLGALSGLSGGMAVQAEETAGEKSFVFGVSSTWNTWLSVNDTVTQNQMIHMMLFEPLITYGDAVYYRACESIDYSEDYKIWTMHLNENITWSDGEPTTADDYVFSWNFLTDPEFGVYTYTYYFNLLEGTEDSGLRAEGSELGVYKIDDYTLELHWKEATSLSDLTTNNMLWSVYPKHILGDLPVAEIMDDPYWSAPIGNGACVFESEPVIGQELVLRARDDYYMELDFDKVTYLVVDTTNAANALLNGDIDTFYPELSTDVRKELDGQNGISFYLDEGTRTIYSLAINNERYSKPVRQALTMLIDKSIIAQAAAGEEGVPQGDPYLIYQDYYQEYTDVVDVDAAKAILDEEGFDYSRPLTLACGEARTNWAMIIQQNLAAAGITVEITTGDASTIFSAQANGEVDAVMMGNNERFDPSSHYDKFSPGTGTYTHNNDDYTIYDLARQIAFTEDEDEKFALAQELQLVYWDICPWIFLFSIPSYIPTTEKLEMKGSSVMTLPWDIHVTA